MLQGPLRDAVLPDSKHMWSAVDPDIKFKTLFEIIQFDKANLMFHPFRSRINLRYSIYMLQTNGIEHLVII